MKQTKYKVIASGYTIECYAYNDKVLSYNFNNHRKGVTKSRIAVTDKESLQRKIESRRRSMQRSNSHLRRLINSNIWRWFKDNGRAYLPVFTTFTFAEEIREIKTANIIFSNFIRRLNYYITDDSKAFLKYVVVVEFQDLNRNGVIHYHVIFFNLKRIMKFTLFELWGQGNIDIKKINNVDNIGAYMSKYMSKHFEDDRLDGLKRYFSSRGLIKPILILDEEKSKKIIDSLPESLIRNKRTFKSLYQGQVTYTQYKLEKHETLLDYVSNIKSHD